ncbi:hypothetical protein BASA81_003463 [Batrachochytrium salamandrivorans]|nr:hypothetical protein BASA81_003463 [Batrachochytrium salamandrivorans]
MLDKENKTATTTMTITMSATTAATAGTGFAFVNVHRSPVTYEWSKTAVAPWCMCNRFTVEGVCADKFCQAFGERVFCDPFSWRREKAFSWRVGDTQARIVCPGCGSPVTPINVGFFNCFFRATGVLAGSGQTVSLLWREAGNAYTTWELGSPASNTLARWASLEFFFRENPRCV